MVMYKVVAIDSRSGIAGAMYLLIMSHFYRVKSASGRSASSEAVAAVRLWRLVFIHTGKLFFHAIVFYRFRGQGLSSGEKLFNRLSTCT